MIRIHELGAVTGYSIMFMDNDVFISYVQPNKDIAFQIHDAIQASKMKSWIAPSSSNGVRLGEYYGGEIIRAIDKCKIVVLIHSEYANTSRHIIREIYNSERKKIIVVKLDKCSFNDDLRLFLNGVQHIEVLEKNYNYAISLLLHQLAHLLHSSTTSLPSEALLFKKGLQLLESKNYLEAERTLSQFVRINPNDPEAKFYLALCMMKGKKPKKLDGLLVKAIENLLCPELASHIASKVLLAVLKQGYYTANGFLQSLPSAQQLLSGLSKQDFLKAKDILVHVDDAENSAWKTLYQCNYS